MLYRTVILWDLSIMIPVATDYTSYIQARNNFVKVLKQVEEGDSIVVLQRLGHADVAMIAADELSSLIRAGLFIAIAYQC
jgi:hypothetical protein